MAQLDLKNATIKIKDGHDTAAEITIQLGEGTLNYTERRNIEYTLDRGAVATAAVREGDENPVEVSFDFIWDYITGAVPATPTGTVTVDTAGAAIAATVVPIDDATGTPVVGSKVLFGAGAADTTLYTVAAGSTNESLNISPGLVVAVVEDDAVTFYGTPTPEDAIKGVGQAAAWLSSDQADACAPYAVDIEITNAPTPAACGDQEVITLSDFRWEELSHDASEGAVAASGTCKITEATVVRSAQ